MNPENADICPKRPIHLPQEVNGNNIATQLKGRHWNTNTETKITKQNQIYPWNLFLSLSKLGFHLFFLVFFIIIIQTLPLGSCITHTTNNSSNSSDYILMAPHSLCSNQVGAIITIIIISIFQTGIWRQSHSPKSHSKRMIDRGCYWGPDDPTSPSLHPWHWSASLWPQHSNYKLVQATY